MTPLGEDFENMTLSELTKATQKYDANTMALEAGRTEFIRRQTQAIQETAEHTKKYTILMFCSVVLLFLSVLGSLIFEYLKYIRG